MAGRGREGVHSFRPLDTKSAPPRSWGRARAFGAHGPIRTADTRFRRAVLYPLSYEGESVASSLTGKNIPQMGTGDAGNFRLLDFCAKRSHEATAPPGGGACFDFFVKI